jgi:hypothetical protein
MNTETMEVGSVQYSFAYSLRRTRKGRMKRFLTLAALSFCMVSCAPAVQRIDHELHSNKYSVRLLIVDENGKLIPAFDGRYVALPGFVFSRGQIRMHPGRQRIGFICPLRPGDVEVLDVAPSVDYDFEAGQRYELKCGAGAPTIQRLDSAGS